MKTIFYRELLVFITMILSCMTFPSLSVALDDEILKENIILALEKKYSGKSFEASFNQISTLAALDISETASGKVFFSHPGKMRWEYQEPAQHEIITNGKSLWMYRPDENQVMTGDASRFFASGAGGAFLSNISLIRENYSIGIKDVADPYLEIHLVAVKKDPDISSIDIKISQATGSIERVITYNSYGDTTRFDFSDIQFKKIHPDIFEFTIPQGVHTIDLE